MSHMHLKLLLNLKMSFQNHGRCSTLNKNILPLTPLLKHTENKQKIRKKKKKKSSERQVESQTINCEANLPNIVIFPTKTRQNLELSHVESIYILSVPFTKFYCQYSGRRNLKIFSLK